MMIFPLQPKAYLSLLTFRECVKARKLDAKTAGVPSSPANNINQVETKFYAFPT
jgi:hypothetical protein